MKIFFSWSGDDSQQIAHAFYKWIPLILQNAQPFLSPRDIDKGAKWATEISRELTETVYGVIFLTKHNLNSQWLAFEAGALSKTIDSRVATVLLGVGHSEVKQPLAMFQGTLFYKDEVLKLIQSINNAAPEKEIRPSEQINLLFDKLWPDLEKEIELILQSTQHNKEKKHEVQAESSTLNNSQLEELLSLARFQNMLLSTPEKLFAPILKEMRSLTKKQDFTYDNAFSLLNRREYFLHPSDILRQESLVNQADTRLSDQKAESQNNQFSQKVDDPKKE